MRKLLLSILLMIPPLVSAAPPPDDEGHYLMFFSPSRRDTIVLRFESDLWAAIRAYNQGAARYSDVINVLYHDDQNSIRHARPRYEVYGGSTRLLVPRSFEHKTFRDKYGSHEAGSLAFTIDKKFNIYVVLAPPYESDVYLARKDSSDDALEKLTWVNATSDEFKSRVKINTVPKAQMTFDQLSLCHTWLTDADADPAGWSLLRLVD